MYKRQRLDCANVLDFNFMKELRRETAAMKEDFWLMGEVIPVSYTHLDVYKRQS